MCSAGIHSTISVRTVWKPILLIILLIFIGVVGYHVIEGWNFFDSLYMTVITIFTVGFNEVRELSPQGRVFTILLIVGGVGTALFAFTKVAEIVFEGGIHEFWRRRKMLKKIEDLNDHYIVCGYGRMGKIVSARLLEEGAPFVVIENDEKKISDLKDEGQLLCIEGDATKEEALNEARIKRAKGLAALLSTDADNLYLVLTARQLHPSLYILSKVVMEEAENKIVQMGADRVVSPYTLSGLKIAQSLMRPTLVDFMDLIIRRNELSLYMEEVVVRKDSLISERSLAECDIRRAADVIVVAIKKPGQEIHFNPSPDVKLEPDDILLVLGEKDDVVQFERTFMEGRS
ncbi:potassium channel protein [bacterium]|nr:MAG: potassium channel protein [bacterium]